MKANLFDIIKPISKANPDIRIRHKFSSATSAGAYCYPARKTLYILPTIHLFADTTEEIQAILWHEVGHIRFDKHFFFTIHKELKADLYAVQKVGIKPILSVLLKVAELNKKDSMIQMRIMALKRGREKELTSIPQKSI